jgi:hypothetical protein
MRNYVNGKLEVERILKDLLCPFRCSDDLLSSRFQALLPLAGRFSGLEGAKESVQRQVRNSSWQ